MCISRWTSRVRRRELQILVTLALVGGVLASHTLTANAAAPPAGAAASPAASETVANFRSVCPVAGQPTTLTAALGDGAAAQAASIDQPIAVSTDAAGDVFVVEAGRARVRRIDAVSGTISTVAGGGSSLVDGGLATETRLNGPRSVAVDPSGTQLFIGEGVGGYDIRRVDLTSGIISTVAGIPGVSRSESDPLSGPGTTLALGVVAAMTLSGSNLYFGDAGTGSVQMLDLGTGQVSLVAGNRSAVNYVESLPIGTTVAATSDRLGPITGLTVDPVGNRLFIADQASIESLDLGAGVIGHYALQGEGFDQYPTGSSSSARTSVSLSIVWDGARLQVADARMNVIRNLDDAGNIARTSGDTVAGFADGTGTARYALPLGLAAAPGGRLVVADTQNNAVRLLDPSTDTVSTIGGFGPRVGDPTGTNTLATSFDLGSLSGVAVDDQGATYVASVYADRIYRIGTDHRVTTFAGTGAVRGDYPAAFVDGQPAASHPFERVGNLRFVIIGGHRWLYAVERWDPVGGRRLVRIDLDGPTHQVFTVTGLDTAGPQAADGAVAATSYYPGGISDYAVDPATGGVYVVDGYDGIVWFIDPVTGLLSRFAGTGNPPPALTADGTPKLSADLGFVWGVAVGSGGTVYIGTQRLSRQVFAVDPAGLLRRVAGADNGSPGTSGDGGPALAAISEPVDLVVDGGGNLILADSTGIRRVTMTSPLVSGNISTIVAGPVGSTNYPALTGETPASASVDGIADQLDFAPDGSLVFADDTVATGEDSFPSAIPTPGAIHMVRRATAGGCANVSARTTGTVILSEGSPVNSSAIPLDGIPPASLTDAALDTFLSSTPLRNSGPGSTPLRNSSVASLPLRNSGAPLVGLQTVPFVDGRRWEDVLRGTIYDGVPVQNITLNQVVTLAASGTAPTLASITLSDLDLSSSPLRNSSIAAIALGPTTLSQLPGQDPPEADPYATTWCPYIESVGLSCADFSGSSTLLDLEVRSAPLRNSPLRNSPLRNSPLRNSDLSSSPLRNSPLRNSNLAASPLRNSPLRNSALGTSAIGGIALSTVPLRNSDVNPSPLRNSPLNSAGPALATVVDCTRVDCTSTSTQTLADAAGLSPSAILPTATVADLFAAFPSSLTDAWVLGDLHEYGSATIGDIAPFMPPTITISDAILAVIPTSSLAWESVGADTLGLPGLGASPAVTMSVDFDLAPNRDPAATKVVVTLPPEGFLVTTAGASSTLSSIPLLGLPDVTQSISPAVSADGKTVTFVVPASFPGGRRYELQLPVTAPRPLTAPVSATVVGAIAGDEGLSAATTSISTADEVASPAPLEPTMSDGDLYMGSISAPGDIDTVDVPVPSVPGAITDVTLSGADVDLDLTAYQPTIRPPMSSRSYRSNGLKTPPLESTDPELASFNQNLDPQVLSDIPIAGNDPSKVLAYSANRGLASEKVSLVARPGDQGVYKIQVSGYDGAFSSHNYLLVVRQHIPDGGGICPARIPPTPAAAPVSPGTITASTRALFLVDEQRMIETYGATAYSSMLAKLNAVAARPEVAGSVIKVDGDPTVRAAYANWDAAPCDSDRANQVVGAVNSLVDRLQATLPGTGPKALTSITLIGSDQILPQARVADGTKDSNEYQYAADTQRAAADGSPLGPSPLSAAEAARSVLTDDAYADWDPYAWRDGALFIPDIGLGRLVEKPSEISVALQAYLSSVTSTTLPANLRGRLTAGSSLTTGYDFLSDGAQAVDTALGARITNRTTLINNTWTKSDLSSDLYPSSGASPDVASLNGHFDHYRALPAAGNSTGDTSDLFTTADVAAKPGLLRGRLIFSMGCHSGLSVPDGYLTGSGTDTDAAVNPAPLPGETEAQTNARGRLLDWAEAFANDGAVYVGNTGYGYGDSSTVAFSERLTALFAADLDGTVTAGQALVKAKNDYYRGAELSFSDYDQKVLQESTFYGLPFWGVGAPATPPAPPAPIVTTPDPATAGIPSKPTTFNPTFTTSQAAAGQVVTADGRAPLVADGEPITARTDTDVTPSDPTLEVHGYLITSLSSVDQVGVTAAFGKPVIDLSATAPVREANGVVFPSTLAGTAVIPSNQGTRQYVNVAVTQFIDDPTNPTPGVGTVRRFTSIGGSALFAPKTDPDGIAPVIATTSATANGSGVRFVVTASDSKPGAAPGSVVPGTIARVVVMYKDGAAWHEVDLGRSTSGSGGPDQFAGSVATTNTSVDYFVQVVDASGNVAVSSNKAALYESTSSPANLAPTVNLGSARQVTVGSVTVSGTYNDPDGPAPLVGHIDLGTGTGSQPVAITPGTGGSGTFSIVASYLTAGVRTVTAQICDNGGACGTATTTLTVVVPLNHAPTVTAGPPLIGVTGSSYGIKITYADPDGPKPVTIAVDDGKGAGFQPVIPVPTSGFTHSVTYSLPGLYTVTVRVCDGLGACGIATTTVLVVSSPGSAGKVVPILDCVTITSTALKARWGYNNTATSTISLPVSVANFFFPTPIAQGQPTSFAPGVHHNVFATSSTSIGTVWVLNARVVGVIRWAPPPGVPTCS